MKFRNTYIIAALFLAMIAYLAFVEAPRHDEDTQSKKLLQLKPEDVTELTLTYPDKQIALKKTAAGWHMQKPLDVAADPSAVTNMISALSDTELRRTLDGESKSLETYGLDKPETVITIGLSNGKTLPGVRVGKAAPVGFSAYAHIEGSPNVVLVPSIFQTGMKRDVKDLRDKTIVDFKDDDVQTIELATPDTTTEVVRDGEAWKIAKPAEYKADATEIKALLAALKGVRAEDFVDQPAALSEYGLDAPRAKISVVVGADNTRKELWIGPEKAKDKKNVVYVKRADADTVYEVGSWIWGGLNKSVSSLRDKTVLAFDLASLATVEVGRRGGEAYRVVKEQGKAPSKSPDGKGPEVAAEPTWKLDGAKSSKALPIGELIEDLHGLKGYEVAAEKPGNLAQFGLADPELTFSLIDGAGKPLGRILVSRVAAGQTANLYAMAEGGDLVLHLRSYLYEHLDKKKEDLVELAPVAPPAPAEK